MDRDSVVSIGLLRESLRGRRKFGGPGAEPLGGTAVPAVSCVNYLGALVTLRHKVGGAAHRATDAHIDRSAVACTIRVCDFD